MKEIAPSSFLCFTVLSGGCSSVTGGRHVDSGGSSIGSGDIEAGSGSLDDDSGDFDVTSGVSDKLALYLTLKIRLLLEGFIEVYSESIHIVYSLESGGSYGKIID